MVTGSNWQLVTILKGVITLGANDYGVESPNTMLAI
jgi:hypothetical protein